METKAKMEMSELISIGLTKHRGYRFGSDELRNEMRQYAWMRILTAMPRFDASKGTLEAFVIARATFAAQDYFRPTTWNREEGKTKELQLDDSYDSGIDVNYESLEAKIQLEKLANSVEMTQREREVFAALKEDKSQAEISRELGIHESRVTQIRQRLFKKMAAAAAATLILTSSLFAQTPVRVTGSAPNGTTRFQLERSNGTLTTIATTTIAGNVLDVTLRANTNSLANTTYKVTYSDGVVESWNLTGSISPITRAQATVGGGNNPPPVSNIVFVTETLSGVANTTTLANDPIEGSITISVNGLVMTEGVDYTRNGRAITFINSGSGWPFASQFTSIVVARYAR